MWSPILFNKYDTTFLKIKLTETNLILILSLVDEKVALRRNNRTVERIILKFTTQ